MKAIIRKLKKIEIYNLSNKINKVEKKIDIFKIELNLFLYSYLWKISNYCLRLIWKTETHNKRLNNLNFNII